MSALPREELRGLFLFEHLSEDQLDWVAANAVLEEYEGDSPSSARATKRPASTSC